MSGRATRTTARPSGDRMTERDYSHRDVVDKLGVKPGHLVAFAEEAWQIDPGLRERIVARTGRSPVVDGDVLDLVFVAADDSTDAVAVLRRWKARLAPAGGIWMLSPKRGHPGYVDQRPLITAGAAASLVDNKSCSVSDTVSAMRFVIRTKDRRTET